MEGVRVVGAGRIGVSAWRACVLRGIGLQLLSQKTRHARRHTKPASADDADALQGIARMAVYGRLKDYSGGVLRKAGLNPQTHQPASTDALQCMILRFRNF